MLDLVKLDISSGASLRCEVEPGSSSSWWQLCRLYSLWGGASSASSDGE